MNAIAAHVFPDHSSMKTPSNPNATPTRNLCEATARALLELRQETQQLHAQLQYLKLLRKLGVRGL
jgi:hypothetical protein